MVELMITLVIVGILLSAGLITLRGYIPKHRLLGTVSEMENLLSRAQSEATARSAWACIKFDAGPPVKATLFADMNSNHSSVVTTCGDTVAGVADTQISLTEFKRDITFAGGCTENISTSCILWFDNTGSPKRCGACAGQAAPATCVDFDYQVIMVNPKLESGTRAREIEVLSGGLIQTVKPGEKGANTTLWADNGNSGCE